MEDDLSFLDFEEVDDNDIVINREEPSISKTFKTSKVPDSVTQLIRGTMSNISSHIDFLSNYDFYNELDVYNISQEEVLDSIKNFDKYESQVYLQSCIKAIFNKLKTSINKPLDIPSNKITDWFERIDTLNWNNNKNKWNSKEGIVARVKLSHPIQEWSIDNFAIMKLQQPGAFKDENLLHEIVVGLVLNNMRTYLPCFMYTYGGMFCGYPTESDMKNSDYSNICDGEDIHTVVITENIGGDLSMAEFISDSTYNVEDKVKVMLMLAFSLDEANKNYNFVHGDLHSKNIMIRTLKKSKDFDFTYSGNSGNYSITIRTQYIPVIIDYGRSSIKYEGYILTPLESSANNRDIKKDGGLFELWCENGVRDSTGENCVAENLVFKGINIPGFDFMRLITTIDLDKFAGVIGSQFLSKVEDCFYGGNYDRISKGGWKGQIKGNMNNYARFTLQTLSSTKDLVNNPSCSPYGFLEGIITDNNFSGILNPIPI